MFDRVFSVDEGVGPVFNENQCSACHTDPASGGTGERRVVKATRFTPPAACDLLEAEGGENVRTQTTPSLAAHGVDREVVPESATEHDRFTTSFLFGLGLVEAIPAEAILTREDPDDLDGDGISGRAARNGGSRLGRFGRKADVATLLEFSSTAFRLEMGLTTPLHATEPGINGAPLPDGVDPAADPEIDGETLALVTDFVRFLAPPPRRLPESRVDRDAVAEGERLFERAGCTDCHTPSMRTGPNGVDALDRKTVFLYSDLLLHDLGPAFAGVCGPSAAPSELRTAPLMGLGHRRAFLHDARAVNVRDAILLHGGEASAARDRFIGLGRVQQEAVLQFLRTL